MFTCERCGVNSADGFIMPDGTWLCTPCAMLMDRVDQNSLSAVAQAKTVQEKIECIADLQRNPDIAKEQRQRRKNHGGENQVSR
jgi:hypothetical protein